MISVIITCYNYGQYVSEAIESVLDSTYRDFEVIVIDDGSTDNTEEVCKRYDIRYFKQKNKGLPTARNNGIKKAKGDWVLPLDADDKISAFYLEDITQTIIDNDCDVIYCDLQHYGYRNDRVQMTAPLTKQTFRNFNPISYCSAIRKELAYYNPKMKFGWEDYEQNIRLFEEGRKFVHIPIAHFFYNRHGTSMIDTSYKPEAVEYSLSVLKKLHPKIYETDDERYYKFFHD